LSSTRQFLLQFRLLLRRTRTMKCRYMPHRVAVTYLPLTHLRCVVRAAINANDCSPNSRRLRRAERGRR
jgi:hypothetical protein